MSKNKATDPRYAPYGLIMGLYTSREQQLDLKEYQGQIDGILRKYKGGLRRQMQPVAARTNPAGRSDGTLTRYLAGLYQAHHIVTFGRFDCGFLAFVDDYDVLSELADPGSTLAQRFETAHIPEQRARSNLLWTKADVLKALRERPCISVSRLKLQIMFTSVLGRRLYEYVYDMCSALVGTRRKGARVMLCEGLGWYDLLMIIAADSFELLGELILPLQGANLETLWSSLSPDDGPARKEEVLKAYGENSAIGREIRKKSRLLRGARKELRQGLPVGNHLFLTTSTTLGYSLRSHRHILDATDVGAGRKRSSAHVNRRLDSYRQRWGYIAEHSHVTVKPGHLGRAYEQLGTDKHGATLKGRDLTDREMAVYFGDTDFIFSWQARRASDESAEPKPVEAAQSPTVVRAVDYIQYALQRRKRLDRFGAETSRSLREEGWRPGHASDFYHFWPEVGIVVSRDDIPEIPSDEVAPFVDILQHSLRPPQKEDGENLLLPKPYLHGLKVLFKTYRTFLRDPFAAEWMLEIVDYVEALSAYFGEVAEGKDIDRVRLAEQISKAVAIFERAFVHRVRSGFRMTHLTDYSLEYKGAISRPLCAIQALLGSVLHAAKQCAPQGENTDSIKAGGLAVLDADPSIRVALVSAKDYRCMGVSLGILAVLRPESLTTLFHEGGHLLKPHRPWREWLYDLSGRERIKQAYEGIIALERGPSTEECARIATLYLSHAVECAAEMLRLAFACDGNWDLYEKVFMIEYHSLHLTSYCKQDIPPGQIMAEDEYAVLPPISNLVDACVRLLCLRSVYLRARGQDPSVRPSLEFTEETLRRVRPYCPELERAFELKQDSNDEQAAGLFRLIDERYRRANMFLSAPLDEIWNDVSRASAPLAERYREKAEAYKAALANGEPVVDDKPPEEKDVPDPAFPTVLHHAMVQLCYDDLLEECVFLPREGILGRIQGRKIAKGSHTFVDRSMGGLFYGTPASREAYFRRRAALVASLWDHATRAKQGKLLDLVREMVLTTGPKGEA